MKYILFFAVIGVLSYSKQSHAGFMDSLNKIVDAVEETVEDVDNTVKNTSKRLNDTAPAAGGDKKAKDNKKQNHVERGRSSRKTGSSGPKSTAHR